MKSDTHKLFSEPENQYKNGKPLKPFSKTQYFIVGLIFLGAIILRFGLSLLNGQANDPHMPVIRYIFRNDELPDHTDCWECFQPKLFHYTIARTVVYLDLVEGKDDDLQKIVAQMMNALAGMVTLVVAWAFILMAFPTVAPRLRLFAFALVAFNPQLIGINSQVTNDTFVIMSGVLASFAAYLFLRQQNVWIFLALIAFSSMAVAAKTNGWVTVIAISITLFIMAWAQKTERTKKGAYAILYVLAIPLLAILNPLTQYRSNYQHYGSPIVFHQEERPAPLFFEKTFVPYAGILSIQDGFLTFKLFDLIRNPITDLQGEVDISSHRTSLWTRLYGSAHSIHFENHPPTWRTLSQEALIISRLIFLLALIPTALMLTGAAMEIYLTLKGMFAQSLSTLQEASFGLVALLFVGHLLFAALYAFEYRMYMFMKAIFVYPALLAFSALFLRGFQVFSVPSNLERWLKILLGISGLCLILLYIWDVTTLILQLLPNWPGTVMLFERLMR